MQRLPGIAIGLVAAIALSGCTDTTGPTYNPGLSGTPDQFARMEGPCLSQASRQTGIPTNQIVVTSRLQTGGGPLLTLDSRGTKLSCRMESNGSVTVFSEFAN